ncbi:MAG TPA: hypothetical protein VG847_14420 [Chitinophagaceae bacterium]|nr:hypothetical protein [Chitinophagaceae bacterium]
MPFNSILFSTKEETSATMPECFGDLHLDQVISSACAGKDEYNLRTFFYTPLASAENINYRQQVFKDLEHPEARQPVETFAAYMKQMRQSWIVYEKSLYDHQKQRIFLDIVTDYCDAVTRLEKGLSSAQLKSQGLLQFADYLKSYLCSSSFITLSSEATELLKDLQGIQYNIVIRQLRIQVLPYNHQPDYSAVIEKTFSRFQQQAQKDYRVKFDNSPDMNHVEAAILKGVSELYPQLFERLKQYASGHTNYLDDTIAAFDREVQFYIAWLQYISELKQRGLLFCYPKILKDSKNVRCSESFDIALAKKLSAENKRVVTNDFCLEKEERIIVVTGPNQGGKTTFARMFGQLHYLARLGCCVPGKEAALFLYDQLLTHFEKEETVETHRSKFEDDLVRIHEMLEKATPGSILILNEIFSSTTLQDATFLNKKIMQIADRLDMLCVWVTFIDELLNLSRKTVSMLSTIEPDNPAARTFKIIRRPANGLAYALSIAEKYHVTYQQLKDRIKV